VRNALGVAGGNAATLTLSRLRIWQALVFSQIVSGTDDCEDELRKGYGQRNVWITQADRLGSVQALSDVG
jgi:hypothetical protein